MSKNIAKEKRVKEINYVISDNLTQIKSSGAKNALFVNLGNVDDLIL